MNITIVGLGLIGASYAKGLTEKGHKVLGVDINNEVLEFAKNNGFVFAVSNDLKDFISDTELLIIGLYPNMVLPYLEQNKHLFNENLIVTDVCGIKGNICAEATKICLPAKFIGSHPMAGREKVGIKYADPNIFIGANFLITPLENTDKKAIDKVEELATILGFGRIHKISPEHHDKMIAYTSQLTHAIAVSLVNSCSSDDTKDFIGDSYRDLTRIAMINESLWSELFAANKENLIEEIDDFTCQLEKIKKALLSGNYDELKELFKSSTEKRGNM